MAAAVFLCVPSFAVLGLAVVLLAMPYVFARSLRRHWRKGVAAGQALHGPLAPQHRKESEEQ